MNKKQSRVPEGTKCCVCKTKPDGGFYRIVEQDGALYPVCSKTCGAQGGFLPKPERKFNKTRTLAPRPQGYQKIDRNSVSFWESL